MKQFKLFYNDEIFDFYVKDFIFYGDKIVILFKKNGKYGSVVIKFKDVISVEEEIYDVFVNISSRLISLNDFKYSYDLGFINSMEFKFFNKDFTLEKTISFDSFNIVKEKEVV